MKIAPSLILAGLLFYGCLGNVSHIPATQSKVNTNMCQHPLILLSPPEIKIQENTLNIGVQEVKEALENIIKKDGCIALSDNKKESYQFKITAISNLSYDKKEGIAQEKEKSTATIKIIFDLQKDEEFIQFSSEKELEADGKRILGLGRGGKISHESILKLLNDTMQNVYSQVLGNTK